MKKIQVRESFRKMKPTGWLFQLKISNLLDENNLRDDIGEHDSENNYLTNVINGNESVMTMIIMIWE